MKSGSQELDTGTAQARLPDVEYDKEGGRRLLIAIADDRAKKDAYNREKGIRRLEKAYKHGALTKGNINKEVTISFLSMMVK